MILCLACKRLWPRGSKWCGSCAATLGMRVCPEGHENLLTTSCCTACGSRKLSDGVKCLNLGGIAWVFGGLVLVLVAPAVYYALNNGLLYLYRYLLNVVFPIALTLGIMWFFLRPILGEKGAGMVGQLVASVFKLVIAVVNLPISLIAKSVKKKKD